MSKTRARPLLSVAVLLAATVALVLLSKNACAAGTCDAEEDFYPSGRVIDKYNWGSTDVIAAYYKWDKKSKYFVQGNRLSQDSALPLRYFMYDSLLC